MQPLWKIVWKFLRKLKMELPFDLAILLLGIYPKNPNTRIQKNLCTPRFTAALFTIAKSWKLINRVEQKTVVHLHNGTLHSRKKEVLPFVTAWMELNTNVLSEISQSIKDK